MMPKLIAFDLDGTLCVSKTPVTPAMGAHIAKLLEKTPVAVISGGSFHQYESQFLPALPEHADLSRMYLLPTSGSVFLAYKNGAWVPTYDLAFSEAEHSEVLSALAQAMEDTGFKNPPAETWGERIEDRGSQITFSALGQQAPPEEKKKWDPDFKKRTPLWSDLTRMLPDFSVRMNSSSSIDITRKGVTKAFGIRKLSEITGIPISDMLYVGDGLFPGGNDEVVKETGIATREVAGPEDTARVISEFVENV